MQAAEALSAQGEAIQLRYLQTLTEIAGEKSSTIVFPLPMNLIGSLQKIIESGDGDGGKG